MAVVIQLYDSVIDPERFGEAMAAIGAEVLAKTRDNSSWIMRKRRGLTLDEIREYVRRNAYGDPEMAVFDAPESAGGSPAPIKAPGPRRGDPSRPLKSLPSLPSKEGTKDQIA